MSKKTKVEDWDLVRTALWGYSTIILLLFMLLSFLPRTETFHTTNPVADVFVFTPILTFVVTVLVEYKHYRWNWWKIICAIYTVVVLLVTIVSVFLLPRVYVSTAHNAIVGVLFFLPMFIITAVLGHERL